jgi:ergothioneine biosynthesis protein EgtB
MREKRELLLQRFLEVQEKFDLLCEPLTAEEFRIQPIVEASPPWWSVMHTGWFYARNILKEMGDYLPVDRKYDILLNSYYHALGPYLEQGIRGRLSEPANDQAHEYRRSVRDRMTGLILRADERNLPRLEFLLEIAFNHEEQHMELLLAEIKRIKGGNPVAELRRPFVNIPENPGDKIPGQVDFIHFQGGNFEFGNLEGGWCWDNELGVHPYHISDFAIMNRPVTNGEYLEFMEDGGYSDSCLWLSSAYDSFIRKGLLNSPLYWENIDGTWWVWTLSGMRKVTPHEPVCHVNFYEAHAFALWKSKTYSSYRGVRLPTEHEWEYAARSCGAVLAGNLLESGLYQPQSASKSVDNIPVQLIGDVWEWTTSHYEPYPGYKPFPEGLVEYNSKFMNNQRVLRGGSCATPRRHIRISYRNYWSPSTQFQFTGVRLARDVE